MADIEYAVLAQFASVGEDGTLTVVGGHRSTFEVSSIPGQHVLCVAGRILLARREPPPMLSLGARTPDGDVPVVARWPLEVHDVPMEGGRRPVAFAATLVAPAPVTGEYALTLLVNDDLVRTLPFTVVHTSEPAEPTEPGEPDPPGPDGAEPLVVPDRSDLRDARDLPETAPPGAGEPRRHGRRSAAPQRATG